MLEILTVKWGTMLFITLIGAYFLMVQGGAAEKLASRPGKVILAGGRTRPSDDFGPKGDDFVNDDLSTVLNNEMVIIEQSYDSVGGFFNADYMVRIEEKFLLVHASK